MINMNGVENFYKFDKLPNKAIGQLEKENQYFNESLKNDTIRNGKMIFKDKLDQKDFLKLMVSELKNQDPLSPMDNKEFIGQMAQFSSLEQISELNSSFKQYVSTSEMNGIYNVLGKKVTYMDEETGRYVQNVANAIEKDGDVKLRIGNNLINPEAIVKVELMQD